MELRDRLRDLRARKGLYQKELADLLGVARSTVAAWETGTKRPEGRTLERLADLYDVSVDYVLGRSEPGMDYDLLKVGLSQRLLLFRERAGLTLKQLSAKTDIPVETLAGYEDDASLDEEDASRLCRALGIAYSDLYPPHVSDPEAATSPTDDLVYFLRGKQLSSEDVEAVKDLLEARRLRREREQRDKSQP